MKHRKRILSMLLAVVMTISLVAGQASASSFNPVVDTITSSSDSRISSMISAISLQSFSSPTASKVQSYISYFINDSTYAAVNGAAWPYTNEGGYVSTVTDGTYTISGINGSGCFAYSKFVMNVIYGTTGSVLKEGESAGSITASGLETFLRTYAQAGEQIRLGNIHSVTFISCDSSGFYYMDYWGGYIRLHYTTFEKFASACNSATSSVELWLYNANTNVNDPTLQTSSSSSTDPTDGSESTLTISPTSYPSGQIIYGNYFNLTGSISSNYTITSIAGILYDESGTAIQTKTDSPDATYVDIKSSVINDLSFGSLPVGSYYLEYTAEDSSGSTVVWTSDSFSVVDAVSTLTITVGDYPTGSMVAQAFDLTGTVTSNYNLTTVVGFINDADGNTMYSATVSGINATSFTILNSGIDNSLPFGSLAVGSYTLTYEASDVSGNTVTWTSPVFYIVASEEEADSSTADEADADESEEAEDASEDTSVTGTSSLKITPTAYPTGNISAGAYNVSGTVTSDKTITSVTAQIVTADGQVEQEVTDTPNSTSYSFSSKINQDLKFGKLSSGYYYMTVSASDSSGNTVTWTSDIFAVSDKTLFVDVTDSSLWYYSQVYSLAQQSIINGIEESGVYYFCPDSSLTRAQAVCLLYRLYSNSFGTPTVTTSHPFTDVASGAWYETELSWAYANSVVNGTSATTFSPDTQITRQELAVLIYNFAVKYYGASACGTNYLSSYADGSTVASWATEAVNWCIDNGIFSSTSATTLTFVATTSATRGQCAVVFYNIQNLFE